MRDQGHQKRNQKLHGGSVIPFPQPCNCTWHPAREWTAAGIVLSPGIDLKAALSAAEEEPWPTPAA